MSAENSDLNAIFVRFLKSLAIHAVIAALAIGLAFWLTSSFDDASATLRSTYAGDAAAQTNIMTLLEDVRGHFLAWIFASLAFSFVASCLFLAIAQRRRPRSPAEGRSGTGTWALLLLMTLVVAAVLWWLNISRADAGGSLVIGSNTGIATAGFIGTCLAYYLGTALAVTITMKPSVPLSSLLPKAWN